MPTVNYYQTERYPESTIRDFVQQFRDLQQYPGLSPQEVAQDYYLHDGGRAYGIMGPVSIDRLWRFDDEAHAPALAFHAIDAEPGDPDEKMFQLFYLDPSLSGAWKQEMDRDREIEEEIITYRLLVSNVGWVIDESDPRSVDYQTVKALFEEYKDEGYGQVTLWSSKYPDPIEEHENPNAVDGKY